MFGGVKILEVGISLTRNYKSKPKVGQNTLAYYAGELVMNKEFFKTDTIDKLAWVFVTGKN